MDGSILEALAYSHALDVMEYIGNEKRGFTEIQRGLELNPNIVNMRLKDLIIADLAKKNSKKYVLTDKGKKALEYALKLDEL